MAPMYNNTKYYTTPATMEEYTFIRPTHTVEQCAHIRAATFNVFGKPVSPSEYVEHALMDGLACLDTNHTVAIIHAAGQSNAYADVYEPIINAIVFIADVYSRKHYALTSIVNWEPDAGSPLPIIADAVARSYQTIGNNEDMFSAIISDNALMIQQCKHDEALFAAIRIDPKHSYDIWLQHAATNVAGMATYEREAAYQRTVNRCVDDWSYAALKRECELLRNAHRRCTDQLNKFAAHISRIHAALPIAHQRPVSMPATSAPRPTSSSAKRIRFPTSLAM